MYAIAFATKPAAVTAMSGRAFARLTRTDATKTTAKAV